MYPIAAFLTWHTSNDIKITIKRNNGKQSLGENEIQMPLWSTLNQL